MHFGGLEIINADWFKLWNGKSIKKIIEDVRAKRNFDIDFIQDVLE